MKTGTPVPTACIAAMLLFALVGCSEDTTSDDVTDTGGSDAAADADSGSNVGPSFDGQPTSEELFSNSVTSVVLEVDYEDGAAPYMSTGPVAGSDPWELSQRNLDRLFEDNGAVVTVPGALSDMENIGDTGRDSHTVQQILDLADQHRDMSSGGHTATYYIIWLDGHFADGDGAVDNVLGVSLGDTGVIAMFKPVIESLGAIEATRAFGEQAVLIHEFGHAAGLVNRGVPLTSEHHDAEHGAHCINRNCVMHYTNEGAAELATFVARVVTAGDVVLFGDECLDDVDALAE